MVGKTGSRINDVHHFRRAQLAAKLLGLAADIGNFLEGAFLFSSRSAQFFSQDGDANASTASRASARLFSPVAWRKAGPRFARLTTRNGAIMAAAHAV